MTAPNELTKFKRSQYERIAKETHLLFGRNLKCNLILKGETYPAFYHGTETIANGISRSCAHPIRAQFIRWRDEYSVGTLLSVEMTAVYCCD